MAEHIQDMTEAPIHLVGLSRTLVRLLRRRFGTSKRQARREDGIAYKLYKLKYTRCRKKAGGSLERLKASFGKQIAEWRSKIVGDASSASE